MIFQNYFNLTNKFVTPLWFFERSNNNFLKIDFYWYDFTINIKEFVLKFCLKVGIFRGFCGIFYSQKDVVKCLNKNSTIFDTNVLLDKLFPAFNVLPEAFCRLDIFWIKTVALKQKMYFFCFFRVRGHRFSFGCINIYKSTFFSST